MDRTGVLRVLGIDLGTTNSTIAEARSDSGEAGPPRVRCVEVEQAAQRRDTLEAARLAGLELSGGDLLDEPVAAFLDYITSQDRGRGQAPYALT